MTLALSGFHSQFDKVLDREMDYQLPEATSIQKVEITDFFADKASSVYKSKDKIKFNIRGDGFLRGMNHQLSFLAKVEMTTPATDDAAFGRDIDSIINKLKIMDGAGNPMEEIQDYDILARILNDTLPPDYFATNGEIKYGMGLLADRQEWAKEGRRYDIQLISGILRNPILYPLAHQGLKVEITLNDTTRGTQSDGTAALNYELTEVHLRLEVVKVSSEYLNEFNNRWAKTGVPYHYTTFDSNSKSLNTSKKQVARVSEDISSLKTYYGAFVVEANLSDDLVQSQKRSSARLVEYQMKHGSTYLPSQPIIVGTDGHDGATNNDELEKGVDAFVEFERAQKTLSAVLPMNINLKEWYDTGTSDATSTGEKFVMSMNFDKSMGDLVSGSKTKNTPLDIIMKFNADPSAHSFFCYLLHDRIATFSSVGMTVEN